MIAQHVFSVRSREPYNDIGIPGGWGFGVGVTPYNRIPTGFEPDTDHDTLVSDGYGNYIYQDGSVMVYVPAFYYKWGTGSNGLALNDVDIKNIWRFRDRAHAALSGYAIHRAFVDGGQIKMGVFVDKYQWSANLYRGNVIASSVKLGNPLSSSSLRQGWGSLLTGLATSDNTLAGAIKAAKTRGLQFFCNSRFIWSALAMLSYAHARAISSAESCEQRLASTNSLEGNNLNSAARTDVDNNSMTRDTNGYDYCGLTSTFAKSTHNGQNSGVADLNGNVWEVTPGLTSDGTQLYLLKESVEMAEVTGGITLATDLWGAAGHAALYANIGATYESATARNAMIRYGSAAQIFSDASSGTAWDWAGFGGALAAGVSAGGAAGFGLDGFWDYRPDLMCPISGGYWYNAMLGGGWTLLCSYRCDGSTVDIGGRSACYFVGLER